MKWIIAVVLIFASAAHALTFTIIEDPCGSGNADYCAPRIFGSGTVEPGDAQRLRDLVTSRHGTPISGVTLSSPGGSLYGGLLLGTEIRKLRLNTYAERDLQSWTPNGRGERVPMTVDPKIRCHSACAYAFLGGIERNVLEGAILGFHQFASAELRAGAEQSAQISMTVLRQYLRQAGVDDELLSIASLTPANSITLISAKQARTLRIDNSQALPKSWTIKALEDGRPTLHTTTLLPGGRELRIALLRGEATVLGRVGVIVPPGVVAADRLREFPVGQKTNVTLGGASALALRAWKSESHSSGGAMFTIDLAFLPDALERAATKPDIRLDDGYSGRALSDVGLMEVPVSREGFASGLKLTGRVR